MIEWFEQSKSLYGEEMKWYGEQAAKAGQTMADEAEKLGKTAQETFNRVYEQQTALFDAYAKHTSAFAEKQMELWRGLFTTEAA